MTASTLTITRPDDWHLHLRDGELMRSVVGATARVFGRAVVMPNLTPPITTVAAAVAYRERIAAALPPRSRFAPLMTLYLNEAMSGEEIARARASGFIIGVKYYPAGATTNSESGVTNPSRAWPALSAMEKHGLPLLVHGEVTDPDVDVFDRERSCARVHSLSGVESFDRKMARGEPAGLCVGCVVCPSLCLSWRRVRRASQS